MWLRKKPSIHECQHGTLEILTMYFAKRLFFAVLISFTLINSALSAKRVALVIGNSDYEHIAPLKNPRNDAATISSALQKVGFDVTTVIDADTQKMRSAFLQFGRQLRKGVDASVFYYAGHAVQYNGENYLIPTPAKILDRDELDFEAVNISSLMRLLNVARNSVNMVILDACRNNPFPESTRSTSRGLAPVSAPRGTYIAYSTAPGNVAYDGDGDNSEYTKALASAIIEPGLEIAQVFRKVRRDVITATGEKQIPWESSSIVGNFYFQKAKPKVVEPPKPSPEVLASRAWRELRESKDKTELLTFFQAHKDTVFADLAKQRLASLAPKKEAAPQIVIPVKENPELLAAREWRKIKGTKNQSLLNKYLSNHGDSEFADLAKRQLSLLQPNSVPVPKVLTSREKELAELESVFAAAQRVNTQRGWQLFLSRYGHIESAEKKALEELASISGGKIPSFASPKNLETLLNLTTDQRKAIQATLHRLGFNPGTPDGQFGPNSRRAISALQAARGFNATGYITSGMLKSANINIKSAFGGDFRSGKSASFASHEELQMLGENWRIVEIIKCFDGHLMTYGQFRKNIYLAVIGRFSKSELDERLSKKTCNGHIVSISSKAENKFVYDLVANDRRFFKINKEKNGAIYKQGPSIGLFQKPGAKEPAGGWTWKSLEPLKFTNWGAGEPNNFGGRQNFASFYGSTSKSIDPDLIKADKWDDTQWSGLAFIAEFPAARIR